MSRFSSRPLLPILPILGLAATLFLAPDARADGPPVTDVATARKLFAEAEKDEEAKQWAAATEKLRRIVAFKETAGVRFHLALAEERLGQLVSARADYQRAFDLSRNLRDADGRDVNERSGASLSDLLKRTPIVTIVPAPDAPTAAVSVDGKPDASAAERPFPHDPTDIVVEATAEGRVPFRFTGKLAEGARLTVAILLPVQGAAPTPLATSPAQPPAADAPPSPPSRAPGYAFAGLAVAGFGTGLGFFLKSRSLAKDGDAVCGRTDVVCDPRRDTTESRYTTVAIVSGAVGVVSAAASVYFFTRGPTTVALGPTGASLAHRFLLRETR